MEINFVKAPASQFAQWPCQIKLVPTNAPYFNGAKLLIAADCTAYAYANMHQEFMRGKVTIIGCPKLDEIDYSEKLTTIIRDNDIKEVTIVRMEVPVAVLKWRQKRQFRKVASLFRGRWLQFLSMVRNWIDGNGFTARENLCKEKSYRIC